MKFIFFFFTRVYQNTNFITGLDRVFFYYFMYNAKIFYLYSKINIYKNKLWKLYTL